MYDLLLPVALIVLGLILLFIEAIVPAFGIIGIAGIMLVGAGIVTIWTTAGMIWGIVAILIAVPVFVVTMIFFFRSRASRIFVQEEKIIGDSSDIPSLTQLIGKHGKAISPLRPSGIALIDKVRYDVVTDGEFIDKGVRITVVKIGTNSIVVERYED